MIEIEKKMFAFGGRRHQLVTINYFRSVDKPPLRGAGCDALPHEDFAEKSGNPVNSVAFGHAG
jgi:hypothetical protein